MARPTFEQFLAGLAETAGAVPVRIVVGVKGAQRNVCIDGDPDMTIPWLVEQGREALRRAAQGEQLDPAEAGQAARHLAGVGR